MSLSESDRCSPRFTAQSGTQRARSQVISSVGLCLPGRADDPICIPISEGGPGFGGSAPATKLTALQGVGEITAMWSLTCGWIVLHLLICCFVVVASGSGGVAGSGWRERGVDAVAL